MKMPFKKSSGGEPKVASGVMVNADGSRVIPVVKGDDTMMLEEAGVIRVGKKKYAVDVYRVAQFEGAAKDEAEKIPAIGQATSWTLYSKMPNGRAAFGSPDIGHRKGMAPLSESIRTDVLGENWIVAVALEAGKFWVSISKDGVITRDEVFALESQALEAVRNENAEVDRPIVAPEAWQIPGSIQTDLKNIVGRKVPALKKFSFIANNGARILIIGLVLLIVGATHMYFKSLEQARIEAERAEAARREKRVVINDADFPWFAKARPEDFLGSCARMINESVRLIPGWSPQPAVCQYADNKVVLTQRYGRTETGRIGWLREAYTGQPGTVSMDAAGDVGFYVVSEDLIGSEVGFDRASPWAAEISSKVITERFQNLGLEPRLTEEISRAPQGAVETATFNSTLFEISTSAFPSGIAYLMSDVKSVVPQTLIWDINTNNWTLTMKVYHPAILPIGAI